MKKIIFLFIFLCSCSVNKPFVKAIDNHTKIILSEYIEYIQKDTTLSEDSKKIRIQSADKLQELINNAKK